MAMSVNFPNKISGKVIVKETGVGIPDLLVVILDKDRDLLQQPIPIQGPSGDLPFDRIGSVLTDENGKFEMEYADDVFRVNDRDIRPDLVIAVLAPEEPSANLPEGTSEQQRMLYNSNLNFPRAKAGRTEAYLIRIPSVQLDKLGVPHQRPISALPVQTFNPKDLEEALKRADEEQEAYSKVFKKRAAKKQKEEDDIRDQAEKAFENFTVSKYSSDIRGLDIYLNPKEANELPAKQESVINRALKDFRDNHPKSNRKMVMHLPDKYVEEIKTRGTAKEVVDEIIKDLGLADQTESVFNGLTRQRKVFETCRNRPPSLGEILKLCSKDSSHQQPEEKPTPPSQFSIEEEIRKQFAHASPPEVALKYGEERKVETERETSTQIISQFAQSAADVVSYHDFNEVLIAFDHISTELSDKPLFDLVPALVADLLERGIIVQISDITGLESLIKQALSVGESLTQEEPLPVLIETYRVFTAEEWNLLSSSERQTFLIELGKLDDNIYGEPELTVAGRSILKNIYIDFFGYSDEVSSPQHFVEQFESLRVYAKDYNKALNQYLVTFHAPVYVAQLRLKRLIQQRRHERTDSASRIRNQEDEKANRLLSIAKELNKRLSEKYKFEIFAPNSVNYGIMLSYRQTWRPGDYQVGKLVSTIPLAPKEIKRYTVKKTVKKSRVQKEIEDNQRNHSSETSSTMRAENEIVDQARKKTSFEANAQGGVNIGVIEAQVGIRFGLEAEKSTSTTRKNFREAVGKAAQEYKQQHHSELEISISDEFSREDFNEISNPNDELTLTCLFYELQRQYTIREHLQSVTPVLLVANEVPRPDEIDYDWLMANGWIVKRVILDDSFLPALDYLLNSPIADEVTVAALRSNAERQAKLVDELVKQVEKKNQFAEESFESLRKIMGMINGANLANVKDLAAGALFGPAGWFASFMGGGGEDQGAKKREEVAKLTLERADKGVQEFSAKLATEVTALNEAIEKYNKAFRDFMDQQVAITRLRIHIKENILYYMQSIWDYEPPDQRFFRLYRVMVPWIDAPQTLSLEMPEEPLTEICKGIRLGRVDKDGFEVEAGIPPLSSDVPRTPRPLHEVADLDRPVGYKGNYTIFPVKRASYLHAYMMQDYYDPLEGLRDPHDEANYTLQEIKDYICCLHEHSPEVFNDPSKRACLEKLLRIGMENEGKEEMTIVVPTDSLFIEALPGTHPILENFKLAHRALDVKKVQAEVRGMELENLRFAARLIDEQYEDPQVEKKIVIEGDASVDVNTE